MKEIIDLINNLEFFQSIEYLAVFFSLLYVLLAAKEKIFCWLAAAISSGMFMYIYFYHQIYAQLSLWFFYLLMAIYGYLTWNKRDKGDNYIKEWSIRKHILIIFVGALLSFVLGFFLSEYTNSPQPVLESFLTIFSIFATYMIIKKVVENWLYWIVIDIIYVYFNYSINLNATAILYVIYAIIAMFAYLSWVKKINYAT